MLHIEREIAEQPLVVEDLLRRELQTASRIAAAIRDFNPTFVHIAARGTSDNAARYGQYLFGILGRKAAGLALPSVHTLYATAPDLSRALVLGISQSGQAEDVIRVVHDAREQGALTISITNAPDSPLASCAQFHLDLGAGQERSVAATKTYTAELTAIALIVTELFDNSELRQHLTQLPIHIADTLQQSAEIATWVERYRYMERFVSIGRGYNYCTAFEISLKIKELCYIIGDGYSEADFRHGPIALVDPGFPVFVVAPDGPTLDSMNDLLIKLNERKAETLVISNNPTILNLAHRKMPFPSAMPEWLTPIAAIIPGQQFAMNLAIACGHAVDSPRGLNKVTITR